MDRSAKVDPAGATHVAAYVVFDDMILIQRRAADRRFLPGAWDVVGGAVEPGETAIEALSREVFEESGIRIAEVGEWITRAEFDLDGRRCVEIGALAWPKDGWPTLEEGKACAFALVSDLAPFVEDNAARGYTAQLEATAGAALEVLRSGAELKRYPVAGPQ